MKLIDLGDDIIFEILSFLAKRDVLELEVISHYFQKIIFSHPYIWKIINLQHLKSIEISSKIQKEKILKFLSKIDSSKIEIFTLNFPLKGLNEIMDVIIGDNKLVELDIGEAGLETFHIIKLFKKKTNIKRIQIGLYEFRNFDINSYGFRQFKDVIKLIDLLNQKLIQVDINICPICLYIFHVYENNQNLCHFCSKLLS